MLKISIKIIFGVFVVTSMMYAGNDENPYISPADQLVIDLLKG